MFNIFGGGKKDELKFTVRVVVYEDEGEWTAHCLDLDLVTTAATEADACKDIIDVIVAQADFAIKNDNLDNLFHPAPKECWDILARAKTCERRAVKKQDHMPVSGVELCVA